MTGDTLVPLWRLMHAVIPTTIRLEDLNADCPSMIVLDGDAVEEYRLFEGEESE